MSSTLEQPAHELLLAEIRQFCEATGTSKSALGWQAVNDPSFVHGLERGREPRFSTIQKVRRYMADRLNGAGHD